MKPLDQRSAGALRVTAMILFFILGFGGCHFSDATQEPTTPHDQVSLVQKKQITITTDAEGTSARPEIAASDNMTFTLFLKNNKSFDLKIYDSTLYTLLATTSIIPGSTTYGVPTDLRLVHDDQHAYLFYETVTASTTYLWAAKYALTASFDLVTVTPTPLASSIPVTNAVDGDEVLNDPAPLLGPNSVFVLTRLMSSLSTTGQTVYRVRELSRADLSQLNQFDLDLSSVADGRARVSSLFYFDNTIYMALPTTVSDNNIFDNRLSDDGALSSILLVKMHSDWTFDPLKDVKTLTSDTGTVENYVNGFQTDGRYVYMSFKKSTGVVGTGEQSGIVKIFDLNFNELLKQTIKKITWGFGEIRPSQQIRGNRLFSGQNNNTGSGPVTSELIVYDIL